jgi:hypothetical protein
MTDSRADRAADHASHDLFVIAAAADRGADDAARSAARQQADTCRECAALLADLQAIRMNIAALPRELAVTKDFRISPERAAQLRGGGWRRLLERFSRAPSLRPMASALTTLGVAGLVITVALPTLFGGFGAGGGASTAAPAELRAQGSAGAAYGPAGSPPAAPGIDSGAGGATKGGQTAAPAAADTQTAGPSPASSSDRSAAFGAASTPPVARDIAGPASPNLVENPPLSPVAIAAWISLALVVIGVGLLLVARLGARIRAG